MYISRFQLLNYKSFRDSGVLEFQPGINIIVGANNAGKTALLEALSLNFEKKSHRTLKTLLHFNSDSCAKVSLVADKSAIEEVAKKLSIDFQFVYSDKTDRTLSAQTMHSLFLEWLEVRAAVEIRVRMEESCKVAEIEKSLSDSLTFNIYCVNKQDYLIDRASGANFNRNTADNEITTRIVQYFSCHTYRLYAERPNLGSCLFGDNSELEPDASNLAEVLNQLQQPGKRKLFNRFLTYVSTIFPEIGLVSVRPKSAIKDSIGIDTSRRSRELEILIWSQEANENEREDLAFPLSEYGTGTGQVLAILYAVLASPEPRTIIIDEPQSYLHPGAAKKLIEILKEFPQHQYFIATHSAEIISAANPSTIVKLRSEGGETKASMMNSQDIKEQRSLLAELGVSLSDVFGADNILWVEGPTEERCFPLILEKVAKKPLRGTQIIAVKNTGDFEGKRAHLVFDVYDKLSGGSSLFPPTVGFVFDLEERCLQEMEDLQKRSQHPVKFLERRMYENYLLHPDAIAAALNQEDAGREQPVSGEEVRERLETHKLNKNYFPKPNTQRSKDDTPKHLANAKWIDKIDAAKVLAALFAELSEARVQFKKTSHSLMLTEWLLENNPEHFADLAQFLRDILDKGKAALD
ncbi:AAA family ATPase [Microcoleus sp. Pol10D4]|uniref:AAA family ATPase n=1 Tax=Microcoleus sp. Pol10D4 TaxID=3055387 RepID=UPI002FD2AC40